jgi:hypothetical protein
MAKKDNCHCDVRLEEIDNGWKVICRCEKKPSLSTKAGWIPAKYDECEHAFPTLEKALAHIKEELGKKHENKEGKK